MQRVAKRFRIKQVNTTAFHPQTNGSLERSHSSLNEFLKFFVQENKSDWDEYIELVTFNFNTGISEATWHSPFELVFGRLARTPGSALIEKEDLAPTYKEYMETLITRVNYLQNIARENLLKAKIRSKKNFDRKVNHLTLKIGDYVWLQKGPKPHKFDNQYTGPYLVLDVSKNGNVKIQLSSNKCKLVHINRLRKSHVGQEQA